MSKAAAPVWYNDPDMVILFSLWKNFFDWTHPKIASELRKRGYKNATVKTVERAMEMWDIRSMIEDYWREIDSKEFTNLISRKFAIDVKQYQVDQAKKKKTGHREMRILISDLHIPFHLESMLAYICAKYSKRVNTLYVNGDIWDQFSWSRFINYNNILTPREEFLTGVKVMHDLSRYFYEVIASEGNHEKRVYKYFMQRIPKELIFKELINYDWADYVSSIIPNFKLSKNVIGSEDLGEHVVSHYTKIGKDCIAGHFEYAAGGNNVLTAATQVYDWLRKWRAHVEDYRDCKLFLQAHTHGVGKATIDGGLITIGETGCACKIQGYSVAPNSKYKPGVPGYWELMLEDGEIDINASNYVLWKP